MFDYETFYKSFTFFELNSYWPEYILEGGAPDISNKIKHLN